MSSLVILTLNEVEGIKALLEEIPFDKFDECFVVDGGSTDGTIEFLKEKGIRVISQDKKGRGEAFRIASNVAKGDILVFFSPDGNENPADILKLKEAIEEGYDMAIASRFLPGAKSEEVGKLFPYRDWGNQFFTFLTNLFFKGNLSDSLNGFRAVRKDKFKEFKVTASYFAIEYQMSIRAMKLKQRVKEIPTIEGQRIGGQSTDRTISTGLNLLKVLLKELRLGKNKL